MLRSLRPMVLSLILTGCSSPPANCPAGYVANDSTRSKVKDLAPEDVQTMEISGPWLNTRIDPATGISSHQMIKDQKTISRVLDAFRASCRLEGIADEPTDEGNYDTIKLHLTKGRPPVFFNPILQDAEQTQGPEVARVLWSLSPDRVRK